MMVSQFFYEIDESQISKETGDFDIISYLRGISDLSSLCVGGTLVIDFKERCLLLVSNRNIFLCGASYEDAKRLGYDFFSEIVYEEDISLLIQIHRAILNSPYIVEKEIQSRIEYFYFTLRMKNYFQLHERQHYLMICYRMKPIFIDTKIRYGICRLTISGERNSGNLGVYFNDTEKFDKYSLPSRRWETQEGLNLDERDKMILRLAKQGLDQQQIAGELCISYQRIRHVIPELYKKLGVDSMEQAVVVASNHLKLFDNR
ncbi:MAG: helix-turn-helix transcriptional regulator [Prevotellaceae bacterium]|jgi:DNA-binding CsgD family transcriptional regulator|nr:helix-turn-helix transcriptional regulator [Prevotellaceae bacterium]